MNVIPEIVCNICLDTHTKVRKSSPGSIKCYTCADGFVCRACIQYIDPGGSIYEGYDYEYVQQAIRCACCRTLNWNYHYNQIVQIMLDYDLEQYYCWDDMYVPPAIKLFFRNKLL